MLSSNGYRLLARPLLFSLPPEVAQRAADIALRQRLIWRGLAPAFRVESQRLHVELSELKLKNPVGLAAGYDKNCEFLPSMAALGFGYVTGGTVTESPRPGNPKPRMIRYVKEQSLINALGFPNMGLEFAVRQLQRAQGRLGQTPAIVSVSGTTADEIVRCHRRLEPLVSAVEINISSPNTANLREFQEPPALTELLSRVNDRRRNPLFVKLPPYASANPPPPSDGEARDRILGLVRVCVEQGVNGLTVANTRPTEDPRLAVGMGGLSGRLIFSDTLRMVSEIKAEVGARVAINASGGIFSGNDAWEALQAGATTIQLLTGLIYHGPGIAKRINQEILAIMDREGAGAIGC